jgi:hypothetical protein
VWWRFIIYIDVLVRHSTEGNWVLTGFGGSFVPCEGINPGAKEAEPKAPCLEEQYVWHPHGEFASTHTSLDRGTEVSTEKL